MLWLLHFNFFNNPSQGMKTEIVTWVSWQISSTKRWFTFLWLEWKPCSTFCLLQQHTPQPGVTTHCPPAWFYTCSCGLYASDCNLSFLPGNQIWKSLSVWISVSVIHDCVFSIMTNFRRRFECGHGFFAWRGGTCPVGVVGPCSSGPLGSVSYNFDSWVWGLELSKTCLRNRL